MIKCGRPRKGEELLSRDRLLDTAHSLFLEYGYGNLSLETIAKDARVSMRTIYSQFGGKAGLFGALIRRCSDQFVSDLSLENVLERSPEDALVSFAKQFLHRITRPDVVRMRAILIGESPRFPDLATQFYEQGPQRTLQHLAQFFAKQQKAGYLAEMDPHFLADQFLSALRSERFQKLQLGLEPTPDEAEIDAWVRQAVGLFLRGSLKHKQGNA
ncbi:TetR/AcrR family transcriptional regulator [Candidatus Methylobacter oryzae]|uniref:TetR/AcrR family transcriptional regulator n=1 Tax=Candidatus Methylobacter oryzae TaxID=2497749 RepID=A0ABY3CAE0_9GAMM|nr:TetR/AcrR family transcriptional regulator [Candidatus Methylobacter oryzae]TRW95126.1 TetR/AcrR family transcriptional regulator [Candidatus Methylobacter oryzae]